MIRILPCFLVFLLCTVSVAHAQIRGAVLDSLTRKPLMEASVSLLSARDSSLVTFSITDGDGRFSLSRVPAGSYRLLITFVGYQNGTKTITITGADADAGTILMLPATKTLNEVIITGERAPVAVRGDTTEFNAGSFKTRPNAQLEDLLKKLPGVEVDHDGTIKAQGQTVKKVLVDGKPFFGDDPKMATRNLPADIVDKVQLFSQQSEQSQFSGVDDGERNQTINISTRPDKRKGTFGQQSAGAGTDNRYAARASINRFNGKQQVSAIGQANNINQQNFTAQDVNPGGGGSFGGQGISVQSGQGRGGGFNNNTGGGNQTAIVRSLLGGLNYRDSWGKRTDVAASYFLNDTRTLTNRQSRRETRLTDSSFVTNQRSNSDRQNQNHRLNLRLESRLDTFTTLRFIPNFTVSRSSNGSQTNSQTFGTRNQPLNSSLANNNSTGNGLSGGTNVLLLRKFQKRGRTISVNYSLNLNNQDTDGINQSQNSFAGSETTNPARIINQRNDQITNSMTNGLTVSYTEPLNLRQTFEFHYALSADQNTSDRAVNDFTEATGGYDRPNRQLTNRFENTFLTNRIGSTWQTRRLKYSYAVGFDMQQSGLETRNQTRDTTFTRQYTSFLPNALFTYTFAKSRSFRFNYRTRINAPSVSQLQPVTDNTNPLNIRLGNSNLRPEFGHTASLFYNNFQATNSRSLFASLTGSLTKHKIVNATTINRVGAQTTQPINVEGNKSMSGFVALGRPLLFKSFKANLNLRTSAAYDRGQNFLNGRANKSDSWQLSQSVSLNSNFNEKFEFSFGGAISYQTAVYSLQPTQNTEFLNPSVTADVYWQLPFRFVLSSDVAYQSYAGKSAGLNQSFALWNAAISRQLFKNQQGEIRLSGYDLLNQNRSVVRNVTDTYVEEVQSRVLNRYFMLSFVYNLRNFTGKSPQMQMPGEGNGERRNGGQRQNGGGGQGRGRQRF